MANLAVFASGNGSNFQAIAEAVRHTNHTLSILICNKKDAYCLKRAENLGVKSFYISYKNKDRDELEAEILQTLKEHKVDLIALAGFMRLLGSALINAYPNRIVNVHPALLPLYPGLNGIARSFNGNETRLGITIHYVDEGMDTGAIISQHSFERFKNGADTLSQAEECIHSLEHKYYPLAVLDLLEKLD